jgi:hypothetical protein
MSIRFFRTIALSIIEKLEKLRTAFRIRVRLMCHLVINETNIWIEYDNNDE